MSIFFGNNTTKNQDYDDIMTQLKGKASILHNHDIYNINGLNDALDGKSAVGHTHNIVDVLNLETQLAGKSNVGHTHSITDVLNLDTQLAGKAAAVHTHNISDITNLTTSLNAKANLSGATFTGDVLVPNLTVSGNLNVNGTMTYIDTANLAVADSLVSIARNNTVSNTLDIGQLGTYNSGGIKYTGIFKDATDGVWKIVSGLTNAPTNNVVDLTGGVYDSLACGTISINGKATFNSNPQIQSLDFVESSSGAVTIRQNNVYAAIGSVGRVQIANQYHWIGRVDALAGIKRPDNPSLYSNGTHLKHHTVGGRVVLSCGSSTTDFETGCNQFQLGYNDLYVSVPSTFNSGIITNSIKSSGGVEIVSGISTLTQSLLNLTTTEATFGTGLDVVVPSKIKTGTFQNSGDFNFYNASNALQFAIEGTQINAGYKRVGNVNDPSLTYDAVNKNYADATYVAKTVASSEILNNATIGVDGGLSGVTNNTRVIEITTATSNKLKRIDFTSSRLYQEILLVNNTGSEILLCWNAGTSNGTFVNICDGNNVLQRNGGTCKIVKIDSTKFSLLRTPTIEQFVNTKWVNDGDLDLFISDRYTYHMFANFGNNVETTVNNVAFDYLSTATVNVAKYALVPTGSPAVTIVGNTVGDNTTQSYRMRGFMYSFTQLDILFKGLTADNYYQLLVFSMYYDSAARYWTLEDIMTGQKRIIQQNFYGSSTGCIASYIFKYNNSTTHDFRITNTSTGAHIYAIALRDLGTSI